MINTWQVIQRDVEPLIAQLQQHAQNHDKTYYYALREHHNLEDRVAIAARFIYLNKTCYNGLWRVNSQGRFNVPIGSYKNPTICNADLLRACHRALRGVDIRLRDFRDIQPSAGDFVYFDPPYHPLDDASFTSYARHGFGKADQECLRDLCFRLHRDGVRLMLSNSDTAFVRALYADDAFRVETVQAPRMVNRDASKRGDVNELLITNYEAGR